MHNHERVNSGLVYLAPALYCARIGCNKYQLSIALAVPCYLKAIRPVNKDATYKPFALVEASQLVSHAGTSRTTSQRGLDMVQHYSSCTHHQSHPDPWPCSLIHMSYLVLSTDCTQYQQVPRIIQDNASLNTQLP